MCRPKPLATPLKLLTLQAGARTTESFDQVTTNVFNNVNCVNKSISDMPRHEQKASHSMSVTTTVTIISSTLILIAVFIAIAIRTVCMNSEYPTKLKLA